MLPTRDTWIFGLDGEALHALTASPTPSPSAATPADLRTNLIQRHSDARRLSGCGGFERWN